MASEVESLTIDYEEDGVERVKELDKRVLTKGAWATLIFRYQQLEKDKNGVESFSDDRYSIRRYKKQNGEYRQQSKFNISSPDQAKKIVEILTEWTSGPTK